MERHELERLNKPSLLEAAQQLFDQLETAKADLAGAEEKHNTETDELRAAHAEELTSIKSEAKEVEDTLNGIIAELRSTLSETKKEVSNQKKTVKHDGKEYEVKLPVFRHNGKTFKADDLKSNPALVKTLVEMGAGVLEEVKK